jgi:hypothetical protein
MRHRLIHATILVLLSLLMLGCADTAPVLVSVRTAADRTPVEHALVLVRPTSVLNVFRGDPEDPDGEPWAGYTDDEGNVVVMVALKNDLWIKVTAEGHAIHEWSVPHVYQVGDSGWGGPNVASDGRKATLQIRARPER